MRFVPVKSEEQLSMQSLHRYRSRLVGNSTQLTNQVRAFLLERGNRPEALRAQNSASPVYPDNRLQRLTERNLYALACIALGILAVRNC